MTNFELFRFIALALIMLCSGGLFYFAWFVNGKLGEIIRERDQLILDKFELEKQNLELRIKLEYMVKSE